MTFFVQSGDLFSPTAGRDSMLESLPVGNYIVVETLSGFKFKRVDSFRDPGHMYGNTNYRAERILQTFQDRPRSTGVLLSGEKGSGKSQLARVVSWRGYELGMPTILVNAPYAGDAFNDLLASIEQPAIILMDEFEKVYEDNSTQEAVLTLLDGMMTSKKLFVLTVNNKYKVNEHMRNRPGRLYYSIEFSGLETEFIREYCEDNLQNMDELENILKIAALFKAFNFDMLKALVEELNRYGESAFEAVELLNAKPLDSTYDAQYDVVFTSPSGLVSEPTVTSEIPLNGNRSTVGVYATWLKPAGGFEKYQEELGIYEEDLEEATHKRHFAISSKDLKKIDVDAGSYQYVVEGGWKVDYTKKAVTSASSVYLDV